MDVSIDDKTTGTPPPPVDQPSTLPDVEALREAIRKTVEEKYPQEGFKYDVLGGPFQDFKEGVIRHLGGEWATSSIVGTLEFDRLVAETWGDLKDEVEADAQRAREKERGVVRFPPLSKDRVAALWASIEADRAEAAAAAKLARRG